MFKTFDYICTNNECSEKEVKKEKLVKVINSMITDKVICEKCKKEMTKCFSIGAIKTADNNGRMNFNH